MNFKIGDRGHPVMYLNVSNSGCIFEFGGLLNCASSFDQDRGENFLPPLPCCPQLCNSECSSICSSSYNTLSNVTADSIIEGSFVFRFIPLPEDDPLIPLHDTLVITDVKF